MIGSIIISEIKRLIEVGDKLKNESEKLISETEELLNSKENQEKNEYHRYMSTEKKYGVMERNAL